MPRLRMDDVGQLKPVECSYATCQQRFDHERDMKRHKKDDPEHHYCKKCDIDCLNHEDFLKHKVLAMQPWLQGNMIGNTNDSPRHITCEFCGSDFKSFGGRRIHQEQMHQAQQQITCPGCQTIFTRAGDFVGHLEIGDCSHIGRQQYVKNMQHKHVVGQIMQDPGRFMENVQASTAYVDPTAFPEDAFPGLPSASVGSIADSDALEADTGGISIMDMDDDDSSLLDLKPLKTEINLIDLRMPNAPNIQPGLYSSQSPAGLSPWQSLSPSPFDTASIHTGSGQIPTETYPPLISSSPCADGDIGKPNAHPTAWTTGQTSRALFHNAPATPPVAGDWESHLEAREKSQARDHSNLLHHRFWDPTDPNYNPALFYHADVRQWKCPFAECDDFAVFDDRADIEDHMRRAHVQRQYRCPLCLKLFQSASALVMHSEAPGRCRVKESSMYKKMIDELSGGFLNVQSVRQPRVFSPETALVQQGHIVDGVTTKLFTAQMAEQG